MRLAHLLAACLLPLAAAAAATTTSSPEALFKELCSDCHTVKPGTNKRGPSLAGVVGRQSGKVAGYNYSDAMRNAGVTWTPERLARYLAAPKTDIPGTKMRLLIPPKPEEVRVLIEWLEKLPG